ncbi:MAG: hypothetical protein ACRELB_04310 [Polyangiaceae bacterium]
MRSALQLAFSLGCACSCHPVTTLGSAGRIDAGNAPCAGSRFELERVLADCSVSASGPLDPILEGKHDANELHVDALPPELRVKAGAVLDIAVSYVSDLSAEAEFVLYGVPSILAWDTARRPVRVVPPGMDDVDGPCWSEC